MRVTFIGGGNMASALIAGLAADTVINWSIRVADPSREARQRLEKVRGVECFSSAATAIESAQVIVLAVKPQVMDQVLDEIHGRVPADSLVISVAAGIKISTLRAAFGENEAIIRAMPNTPALLGKGITGMYAAPGCSVDQKASARAIMATAGATVWVETESLINAVTAISGSGPAYYYLLTEALCEAGQELGLPPETSLQLARHTAYGAGAMIMAANVDVAELRRRVTSPGGTTQAALDALGEGGFSVLIEIAARAAEKRGRELSGDSGE